ncbi:hypothetical protein FQA39_LY09209 [Lamprigera yunnana]|nr:hypothetical protein FQA39_LY09209 [Lamprigera yunnana]
MSDSDESDYILHQEFESDISDSDEEFSDSESEDDFIEPRIFGDWKVVSSPFIDRLSEATVHVVSKLGSVTLEYFFWRVIGNVKGKYCSGAPNVSRVHEPQCVSTL